MESRNPRLRPSLISLSSDENYEQGILNVSTPELLGDSIALSLSSCSSPDLEEFETTTVGWVRSTLPPLSNENETVNIYSTHSELKSKEDNCCASRFVYGDGDKGFRPQVQSPIISSSTFPQNRQARIIDGNLYTLPNLLHSGASIHCSKSVDVNSISEMESSGFYSDASDVRNPSECSSSNSCSCRECTVKIRCIHGNATKVSAPHTSFAYTSSLSDIPSSVEKVHECRPLKCGAGIQHIPDIHKSYSLMDTEGSENSSLNGVLSRRPRTTSDSDFKSTKSNTSARSHSISHISTSTLCLADFNTLANQSSSCSESEPTKSCPATVLRKNKSDTNKQFGSNRTRNKRASNDGRGPEISHKVSSRDRVDRAPKKPGRWDAVMTKIAENKEKTINVRGVKSKVHAVPNSAVSHNKETSSARSNSNVAKDASNVLSSRYQTSGPSKNEPKLPSRGNVGTPRQISNLSSSSDYSNNTGISVAKSTNKQVNKANSTLKGSTTKGKNTLSNEVRKKEGDKKEAQPKNKGPNGFKAENVQAQTRGVNVPATSVRAKGGKTPRGPSSVKPLRDQNRMGPVGKNFNSNQRNTSEKPIVPFPMILDSDNDNNNFLEPRNGDADVENQTSHLLSENARLQEALTRSENLEAYRLSKLASCESELDRCARVIASLAIVVQHYHLGLDTLQNKLEVENTSKISLQNQLNVETEAAAHALIERTRERQCYREEIASLMERHEEEITKVETSAQEAIKACEKEYETKQRLKETAFAQEVEQLREDHQKELSNASIRHRQLLEDHTRNSPNSDILLKEIDSLRVVLDMRNQEIRELRRDILEYEQTKEDLCSSREQNRSYSAKVEDLEAQLTKARDDKGRLYEQFRCLEVSLHSLESENSRLSQNNEELVWRMQTLRRESTEGLHHGRTQASIQFGSRSHIDQNKSLWNNMPKRHDTPNFCDSPSTDSTSYHNFQPSMNASRLDPADPSGGHFTSTPVCPRKSIPFNDVPTTSSSSSGPTRTLTQDESNLNRHIFESSHSFGGISQTPNSEVKPDLGHES